MLSKGKPQDRHMEDSMKFIRDRHSGHSEKNSSFLFGSTKDPQTAHLKGNSISARPEIEFVASHIIAEAGNRLNGFFDGHNGNIRPQPLNVIKLSYGFIKYVNDYIAVIYKHPLAGIRTFHTER